MNSQATLLTRYFFARTDVVAVQAFWGLPCPVDAIGKFDLLVQSHLLGEQAGTFTIPRADKKGRGRFLDSPFRLGSYTPDHEGKTPFLSIDVDGGRKHSDPVVDALAAAQRIKQAFESHGLRVYLEKSGGSEGWHLWVFFETPIPASKARRLARPMIPSDIEMVKGGFADPEESKGVEIFPKADSIREDGVGNLVYLPFWSGALNGANQFHDLQHGSEPQPYMPDDFDTNTEAKIDQVLVVVDPPQEPPASKKPSPITKTRDSVWAQWRRVALAALRLEDVYGEWLTGKQKNNGWLECRDPKSKTGDRSPSASVADGSGEAERGFFHSFRDDRKISVFDFLIERDPSLKIKDACRVVADLSGVPMPKGIPRLSDESTQKAKAKTGHQGVETVAMVSEHRTDLGNARRLVGRYGNDIRYVHLWKKWLCWDGQRWKLDDSGQIMRLAKETVGSLYAVASNSSGDDRQDLVKWALQSESEKRLQAMIALAQSELGIPVTPDELDRDKWLLNCQNGTLNLRGLNLGVHDRSHLITKVTSAPYDPNAKCELWLRFLDRIFSENPGLIAFVQRAAGYALTGETYEHCIFIPYGKGRNGKSTLLEALASLLNDYAQQTPTETLLSVHGNRIPNDVAQLKGARLVTAVEVEEGRRLNESLVKQLTGGDRVKARFLHAEFFQYVPECKLFLAVNHLPEVRGTDNAIWERIKPIPFDVTIPKAERDKQLPQKLIAEMAGILAWCVGGCTAWQLGGLGEPREVLGATEKYREEMDVLGSFVSAKCFVGLDAKCKSGLLFESYTDWCVKANEKPLRQKDFVLRMEERGFKREKSSSIVWQGIGLLTDREIKQ